MKRILYALSVVVVSGCSSWSAPAVPDGGSREKVNSPAVVSEVMAEYYRSRRAEQAKSVAPKNTVKLAISEVLAKHVPPDIRAYVDPDVHLSTVIEFDPTRNWIESLGTPLSEAGIEMTANLKEKVLSLKVAPITAAKAIQRLVPADYTVFVSDGVDLGTKIKVDRSGHWIEEMGRALREAGLIMTVNLDQKIVIIRPVKKNAIDDGKVLKSKGGV